MRYKRFVLEVTQGSEAATGKYGAQPHGHIPPSRFGEAVDGSSAFAGAFDLLQTAMDAALLDLLIDRSAKRLAACEAFVEEATEGHRSGPAAQYRYLAEIKVSMKLIERKQKLIDKCQKIRSDAIDATPPDEVSLAEFMQAVLEVGGKDAIYDSVEFDDEDSELAKTWSLPGDTNPPKGWPRPPPCESGD